MIFETLNESSERGELLLIDGGFCHWHLRRDGQLTIREIISTRRGAGQRILNRLIHTPGAQSLFAKCPSDLPANDWYAKRGFKKVSEEATKTGRTLICWRLDINSHRESVNAGGIELIFCADSNIRYAEVALDAGWHYGAQLPNPSYFRPYFIDQDWKNPDFEGYVAAASRYQPYLATVLDWERVEQWDEVMRWAEAVSPYVETVIVIPKVVGQTWRIPSLIGGKSVRLGYSVKTSWAGTPVPLSEFEDRPVHLLGGSPHEQLELAHKLNVVSVDQSIAQQMANRCAYWIPRPLWRHAKASHFVTLREADGGWDGMDAPYEAFRRSCNNLAMAWKNHKTSRTPIEETGQQMVMAL